MDIHRISYFKNRLRGKIEFKNWVNRLEAENNCTYEQYEVFTDLGKTHVWGYNTKKTMPETLVIFPGARTTALIWDLDNGLSPLKEKYKIYLVETNGLPNLSDGASPNIKTADYGTWAATVLERLQIEKAYIAGASFGALIAAKLAITHPEKIKSIFMLNPGCLQPFSLSIKNLYYNILPIVRPTTSNVRTFLNKAIFKKPTHQLSSQAEQLLIDYELLALKEYKDKTQKPYFMKEELHSCKATVHLILGDADILFPFQASLKNAERYLPNLENTIVFSGVGHGIETYAPAIEYIKNSIEINSKKIELVS